MSKWLAAGAVLLALAAVPAAFLAVRWRASQDVRGSSTEEFVATEPATATAPVAPPLPGIAWPMYGFNPERTRSIAYMHRPPFRGVWRFGARALVEFPPVIAYGRLYFANENGRVYAVNAKTGRRAWKFEGNRLAASSPAVYDHVLYQTFMQRPGVPKRARKGDGEIVALHVGWGQVRWRRRIGQSETSPLVADGVVYVGDARGFVWALDAATGRVRWKFKAGGAIKGSAALSGRWLYFGSYDHHLYCVDIRTGRLRWRSRVQQRIGRLGRFYATPAVAYGRVYIGATDGKVYSFGATTGRLRWSQSTRGYVYSSAAVWRKRVFVGSYDRSFYALDAATGDVIWRFNAQGKISGSPTVVGDVVYFSTLRRRTFGLDTRTGRVVWRFADGQYTPIVADAERLYLVGRARLYALRPAVIAQAHAGR